MRWCAHCNTSFGSMEEQAVVDGNVVHVRCEAQFRKELADRMARASRHHFLYLPSLGKCGDEQ